jgi:hypothetical protein
MNNLGLLSDDVIEQRIFTQIFIWDCSRTDAIARSGGLVKSTAFYSLGLCLVQQIREFMIFLQWQYG